MEHNALRQRQLPQGAQFSGDNPIAEHFGAPQNELSAVTTHNVVFDVSNRSQVELTGLDRIAFLNNFCTNDVSSIAQGSGCETFLTNVKGRVLAHGFLFVAADAVWLETVPDQAPAIMAHLDRYLIREDVQMQDQTTRQAQLLVACRTACRIADFDLPTAGQRYDHFSADYQGVPVRVRRVPLGTATGLLLSVERCAVADLWTSLCQAGCRPAGELAWQALRISAGFPVYGMDITDENLAQEVSRNRQCISFSKGCYLGQEPIARIDAMGHVNRELRGLRLRHGPAPPVGSLILSETNAAAVGSVTSSSELSVDGPPVALGYLKTGASTPGKQVVVQAGDSEIDAEVFEPAA